MHRHFISLRFSSINHPGEDEIYPLILFSMVDGLTLITRVRRIQRAVRAFLWHRRVQRRRAVMMALHPRLGNQSGLACLPFDMLGLIVSS
jgi:hypothetical protein